MGRGVRTVQRYHATLHLPVHRIASANNSGSKRSPVFAYREELDRWMRRHARQEVAAGIDERLAATKESRDKLSAIRQKVQFWRTASQQANSPGDMFEENRRNRFSFMSIDLDAGLTLAKIAEGALDRRKRARTESSAVVRWTLYSSYTAHPY
jgi:hypothetical protein